MWDLVKSGSLRFWVRWSILAARFEAMCKDLRAPIVVSKLVYSRLPADLTAHLTAHHGQEPKGGVRQTVYSTDRPEAYPHNGHDR